MLARVSAGVVLHALNSARPATIISPARPRIQVNGRSDARLRLAATAATKWFSAARSPNSMPRELTPLRLVEIARQRDMRVPRMAGGADDLGRAPQQGCDRNGRVGGDRDKGGIGAILQQTPHQIGQQIAVAADRRIGPVRQCRTILAQSRIERLAHAMQTLKLVAALVVGKFENGRHRQRVMGGELRKEARPQRQQLLARRRGS